MGMLQGVQNFGNTVIQMGKNAAHDPAGFIGRDGLGATGRAISNSLPKMPTLVPVNDRALPGDNFINGDREGTRIRDSFTPSDTRAKAPRQHASNLQPGENNAYGGRYDFSA